MQTETQVGDGRSVTFEVEASLLAVQTPATGPEVRSESAVERGVPDLVSQTEKIVLALAVTATEELRSSGSGTETWITQGCVLACFEYRC